MTATPTPAIAPASPSTPAAVVDLMHRAGLDPAHAEESVLTEWVMCQYDDGVARSMMIEFHLLNDDGDDLTPDPTASEYARGQYELIARAHGLTGADIDQEAACRVFDKLGAYFWNRAIKRIDCPFDCFEHLYMARFPS